MPSNLYILNFESGLWLHAATEAKVAQQAASAGWKVKTINCDGFFVGFCSVRSSRQRSVRQVKKGVDCADCQFTNRASSKINSKRNVDNLQIGSYLKSSHLEKIHQLVSTAKTMKNPIEFEYEGIKFGRLASFQTILSYKLTSSEISPEARPYYFLQLEDCLRVFFAFSSMLQFQPSKSTFLIRNINYSVHRVIAMLASRSGHTVFGMRTSTNLSSTYTKVRVFRFEEGTPASSLDLCAFRKSKIDSKSLPLVQKEIETHLELLKLGKGWMVYSRKSERLDAEDVRKRLGAPPGKNVLLIALSSTDEVNAAGTAFQELSYPGVVFPSQREMVKAAIDWAKDRSDVFLIVRPHPRESPHGRNPAKSAMTRVWTDMAQELPTNAVFDYVEQGNSLYDVMNIADVVVTGWSTVGIEASVLGKIVVLYDKTLPAYPHELGLSGVTKEEFLSNLDLAFRMSENDRQMFREVGLKWLSFLEKSQFQVPSRFLSESLVKIPKLLKRLINFVDRFMPITRVLDLYLHRKAPDLEPLLQILGGEKNRDQ